MVETKDLLVVLYGLNFLVNPNHKFFGVYSFDSQKDIIC